jgi:hypothetical protein
MWFDSENESFIAEFIQCNILVKGMSVQVQNFPLNKPKPWIFTDMS